MGMGRTMEIHNFYPIKLIFTKFHIDCWVRIVNWDLFWRKAAKYNKENFKNNWIFYLPSVCKIDWNFLFLVFLPKWPRYNFFGFNC